MEITCDKGKLLGMKKDQDYKGKRSEMPDVCVGFRIALWNNQ